MRVLGSRTRIVTLALASLLMAGGTQSLDSQEIRVTGVSFLRFVQVRPLVSDSVPVETTRGDGLLRRTLDGELVRCVTGDPFCRFRRTGSSTSTVPGSQDLRVSAWGFGPGIRGFAHLRSRATLVGEEDLWPRSGDHVDALELFLELRRPRFRIRGGRQWKVSGLGYYNYDGASVEVQVLDGLAVEAYGGWSLARGLSEPRTSDALEAIESLAPNDRGQIVGIGARYRPSSAWAVSGLYQREVRGDRKGLYSERLTTSGFLRRSPLRLEGTLELDLVTREVNELSLHLAARARSDLSFSSFVRRYRPFFELWTIWGAFDPVGFDEAGLGVFWRPAERSLSLSARGSRRWYPETHAGFEATPMRSDGWRLSLGASGAPWTHWEVQGDFLADVGFGAAKSQERLRVIRALGRDRYLAAGLVAFQTLFEFRVSEGTVWGLTLEGGTPVGARARVSGALAGYRHGGSGTETDLDWSQLRGSIRFEWTLGPEPGLGRDGGGGP